MARLKILHRDKDLIVIHKPSGMKTYRDEKGELHTYSAVCPHLQCIVRWNALEKSFDCPCHGSRFAADGHAINGPAIDGLTPVPRPVS